jgi:hypothetical protein
MQKLSIAATGVYLVDVAPGRTIRLATSGTITATIKYLTAPGTYQAFATPLTLAGEQSVINCGAHGELAIDVTAVTPTAIVIANVLPA